MSRSPALFGALLAAVLAGVSVSPARSQTATVDNSAAVEGAKAVALLQELIRIDTSNPPGDTSKLAALLKPRFEALGAQVDVITAPNGKATHFIARFKGDGSKRPILLTA